MSYLLFIRPPLETRKIHIHTVLFPEPKVRQRKLKYAKILSKTPRENYFLSEVYINTSFASGIFNELSHLLLSTLETCFNSFQTPIPFLSRRNRTNESVDMPQKLHSNAPSYLKSFLSVTNLTSHEYIFSRVKLTSCALIRSDWFSASMRRQVFLDPLSPRAERCVTERGDRTGLDSNMLVIFSLKNVKGSLTTIILCAREVWNPPFSVPSGIWHFAKWKEILVHPCRFASLWSWTSSIAF